MKIKELLASAPALSRLSAMPLNATLAFRLKRIVKQVNSELETFEAQRKESCERYGTLSEDKSQYDFTDEKRKAFEEDFNKLMEEEVEIRFDHFTEESLAGEKIAASDLMLLEWLFVGAEKPELYAVEKTA